MSEKNFDSVNSNCVRNSDKCDKNSDSDLYKNTDKITYNYFGFKFNAKLIWLNIFGITILHILFLYFVGSERFFKMSALTNLWAYVTAVIGAFGITGGVHRFWTHRSYKAKPSLKIILMLCFCMTGQSTIYKWVRDHRLHHKFTDTDADPHNSKRGFFFSHVGWLMMEKHPDVIRQTKFLDMSDIQNDPVVQLHIKYFIPLKLMMCFILPTVIPIYFWGESFHNAFFSQCVMRYAMTMNGNWFVNSAAHMWGTKPYDKRINPVQNILVSIYGLGEGWHNYHHVFPWDYRAAEFGHYINVTAFVIDMFAKIGWAYDLRHPSKDLIKNTILKYGDNSHNIHKLMAEEFSPSNIT